MKVEDEEEEDVGACWISPVGAIGGVITYYAQKGYTSMR